MGFNSGFKGLNGLLDMQYAPIKGMRFMLGRLFRRCDSWNVKRVLNGILLLILCNCLCFLH